MYLSPDTDIASLLETYLLTSVQIEATTGEINAIRVLSLNRHISSTLNKLIKQQNGTPFDLFEYKNTLSDIYAHYSTNQMVKNLLCDSICRFYHSLPHQYKQECKTP